jgi:hypothetical protein
VGTHQREAILVLLDLLYPYLPSFDRMALFAAGSKLALVNVGMTVSAFLSHVGEDRLEVALGARHVLMHAAERVARLTVIKLRDVANRFPPTERVTILAGNIQRAMRAASVAVDLRLGHCGGTSGQQEERQRKADQNRPAQYGSSNHGFPERHAQLRQSMPQTLQSDVHSYYCCARSRKSYASPYSRACSYIVQIPGVCRSGLAEM